MTYPATAAKKLPTFSTIDVDQIKARIEGLIERNKRDIDTLLTNSDTFSWDDLPGAIEAMDEELASAWSPVSHLNHVRNSDELRDAYNACLPLLSAYSTWSGQHQSLYQAYQSIANSHDYAALDAGARTALDHALRDFKLAGVALPEDRKQRYGELKARLSELGAKFGENVLDATNAWSRQATEEELAGLPDSALAVARQAAEQKGLDGYLITLEFPSYFPVLTFCDNAELRREVYEANATRASELGPHSGQFDNATTIVEILDLRRELAEILDFDSYAALSLATKMADDPDQVVAFLRELAAKSRPQAQAEFNELEAYAREEHGVATLNAWDVGYYSEKLKQARYEVSQEDIRPYLPVNRVLPGLFEVAKRLWGVTIREVADFDSYHPDVQLYEIMRDDEVIARFYLDLYARAHKRGGAWMDGFSPRRMAGDSIQLPVAFLVCNFTPPVGDAPALLTHNELTTLFHEFGHGVHHMLTQQTVAAVSGVHGVPWDAVELPSQFLENWCWEPGALAFISGHHETGEPLPQALLDKMLAAKNFQSAMMMVRQLEFALFDFLLHMTWKGGDSTDVQKILDAVRSEVAVMPIPGFNRFQNSFSHIFAGGYAAGYYSYKWAEVLSADAFSRFEEEGIFNADTGLSFLQEVLEVGGSKEPMAAFIAFRGREPSIEPLLRHSGIAA
ncbi:oligopeptidase A [Halioglobus japonicus]|uniref:oligopeptidase A n=1 Tax=Halioglobus japonicus TaxID=930805 RepID=A0AAP8MFS8_9GAMM|nr:oligopeptidase A [Halioglobus japonicus]AQA19858.1 oligopeptidase A [Halioglobus japonicus]PLW87068.1 oligopeptidase A [Halioglobus japonicus]GHD10379.1 oligopeptidase A [Halioglobus japonicus]